MKLKSKVHHFSMMHIQDTARCLLHRQSSHKRHISFQWVEILQKYVCLTNVTELREITRLEVPCVSTDLQYVS
jgi:hypothetical protein